MAEFDSKIFNENKFGKYVSMIENPHLNMFMKAGIFVPVSETVRSLPDAAGGNYVTEPIKGLLDGEVLNYDGKTDNTPTSRDTYSQSKVVYGRMKAWVEKDFSTDIAGAEFLPEKEMAGEVAEYYENVDQKTLLSVLEGIFAMNDTAGKKFVDKHTNDIGGPITATSMNRTVTKASGDNKKIYKVAIMHSEVAAQYEDLQLVEYLKYTDAEGIARDIGLARVGGKTVLIDDDAPVIKGGDGEADKYVTYLFGSGAFEFGRIGVKNPYKMAYDPEKNGGQTALYTKIRAVIAPKWISFTKKAMASDSPTDAEFRNGQNWEIVKNAKGTKHVDDKFIPIARMISTVE